MADEEMKKSRVKPVTRMFWFLTAMSDPRIFSAWALHEAKLDSNELALTWVFFIAEANEIRGIFQKEAMLAIPIEHAELFVKEAFYFFILNYRKTHNCQRLMAASAQYLMHPSLPFEEKILFLETISMLCSKIFKHIPYDKKKILKVDIESEKIATKITKIFDKITDSKVAKVKAAKYFVDKQMKLFKKFPRNESSTDLLWMHIFAQHMDITALILSHWKTNVTIPEYEECPDEFQRNWLDCSTKACKINVIGWIDKHFAFSRHLISKPPAPKAISAQNQQTKVIPDGKGIKKDGSGEFKAPMSFGVEPTIINAESAIFKLDKKNDMQSKSELMRQAQIDQESIGEGFNLDIIDNAFWCACM